MRACIQKLRVIFRKFPDRTDAQMQFINHFYDFATDYDGLEADRVKFYTTRFVKARWPDAEVRFAAKESGGQRGIIAIVEAPPTTLTYYVKTHGKGQKCTGRMYSTALPVSPRELVFYKFFESIGIGCESSFFGPDETHCYIATLDAGQAQSFCRFDELTPIGAWSTWAAATADGGVGISTVEEAVAADATAQRYAQNLLMTYLLSELLSLSDVVDNPKNFGFLVETGDLRIFDFNVDRVRPVLDANIELLVNPQQTPSHVTSPFLRYIFAERDVSLRLSDMKALMLRYDEGPKSRLLCALEKATDEVSCEKFIRDKEGFKSDLSIVASNIAALSAFVKRSCASAGGETGYAVRGDAESGSMAC